MRHITLGLTLASLTIAACSFSSDESDGPLAGQPKTASGACVQPIEGKDPSGLPVCTGTKGVNGRCVARADLGTFSDTFEQASCGGDQACVPDEVVRRG